MARCKSCSYFKECSIKYRTKPNTRSCPELKLQVCGQCKWFDQCVKEFGVSTGTESCEEFEVDVKNRLHNSIEILFKDYVLPALKSNEGISDPDDISKIEYLSSILGSLVNKPVPEDIHRERIFMELMYEDFEIDSALENATETIQRILISQGFNVPFNSNKIKTIVQSISEVRLIYQLSLACGLAGYIDQIMSNVITSKFGYRAQIKE